MPARLIFLSSDQSTTHALGRKNTVVSWANIQQNRSVMRTLLFNFVVALFC